LEDASRPQEENTPTNFGGTSKLLGRGASLMTLRERNSAPFQRQAQEVKSQTTFPVFCRLTFSGTGHFILV
jgi:hypothetical protein